MRQPHRITKSSQTAMFSVYGYIIHLSPESNKNIPASAARIDDWWETRHFQQFRFSRCQFEGLIAGKCDSIRCHGGHGAKPIQRATKRCMKSLGLEPPIHIPKVFIKDVLYHDVSLSHFHHFFVNTRLRQNHTGWLYIFSISPFLANWLENMKVMKVLNYTVIYIMLFNI